MSTIILHLRFFTLSKGLMSGFNSNYAFHIWCHFYFHTYLVFLWLSRSILITIIHGRVPRDFQKPLPSNDVSLHFTIEPRPSVTTHCSSLQPWKLLKSKFRLSPPWKRSQTARLKSDLLFVRPLVYIQIN